MLRSFLALLLYIERKSHKSYHVIHESLKVYLKTRLIFSLLTILVIRYYRLSIKIKYN